MAKWALTGAEPMYRPTPWNSAGNRATHNCYAFFLQDLEDRDGFPQPGALADRRRPIIIGQDAQAANNDNGPARYSLSEPYSCAALRRAVLADNPSIKRSLKYARCPRDHYKAYMAVDDSAADGDYHFWVQNADGSWSHKPGEQPVTQLDADGRRIDDPETSNRGRYTRSCGFVCVPSNALLDTRSAERIG